MARGPAAATATTISCCGLAACSTQNCRGQYRRAAQLRSVFLWIHFRKCCHLRARALQVLGQAPPHLPRHPKDYALVIVQRAGQQVVRLGAQKVFHRIARVGARGAHWIVAPVQQHLWQWAHARITLRMRLTQRQCAVAGAVVQRHHLKVRQALRQQAVQRSAQRGACIVHWQQHRNPWHARIVQVRRVRAVHSPRC